MITIKKPNLTLYMKDKLLKNPLQISTIAQDWI